MNYLLGETNEYRISHCATDVACFVIIPWLSDLAHPMLADWVCQSQVFGR